MATSWCRLMILQLLITTVTQSSGFDDNPKSSHENMILLLNKFFEDINNQRVSEETNDQVDQLKDFYYRSLLALLNGKRNVDEMNNNQDSLKIPFGDAQQTVNNNDNVGQKRGKNHYVTTLCRFKICNKKRSMDNNFMRYITKNAQQF